MFEVWLQMSDTNIDTENPSDLPALLVRELSYKQFSVITFQHYKIQKSHNCVIIFFLQNTRFCVTRTSIGVM